MMHNKRMIGMNTGAVFIIFFSILLGSCSGGGKNGKLPYLGRFEVVKNGEGKDARIDTVWHTIKNFQYVDQDSNVVSLETFEDDIYISDFFFTTCPDICPIMKNQMLRVYDAFIDQPDIKFLSHTIDPKHDTVAVLKAYADLLDIDSEKWKFVTGNKEDIYKHGQTSYMASMADQGDQGLTHSGRFFLIDKERRIRGAYDGTNEKQVDILISDIRTLLKEYENSL